MQMVIHSEEENYVKGASNRTQIIDRSLEVDLDGRPEQLFRQLDPGLAGPVLRYIIARQNVSGPPAFCVKAPVPVPAPDVQDRLSDKVLSVEVLFDERPAGPTICVVVWVACSVRPGPKSVTEVELVVPDDFVDSPLQSVGAGVH